MLIEIACEQLKSLHICRLPSPLLLGLPIRSTLDSKSTLQYSALITQLTAKARSIVRDLDPMNDLTFLRIRSKKHEIMISPDKEYILIVIQDPNAEQINA